jgi:phosphoribosylamine--glycine ligase
VTNGGRVLDVTGIGATVEEARAKAYGAVDAIAFEGAWCRRDIALAAAHGNVLSLRR